MKNDNDTPIDNDVAVINENFRGYNFRELPRNRETRESFHPQKIPAIRYSRLIICCLLSIVREFWTYQWVVVPTSAPSALLKEKSRNFLLPS